MNGSCSSSFATLRLRLPSIPVEPFVWFDLFDSRPPPPLVKEKRVVCPFPFPIASLFKSRPPWKGWKTHLPRANLLRPIVQTLSKQYQNPISSHNIGSPPLGDLHTRLDRLSFPDLLRGTLSIPQHRHHGCDLLAAPGLWWNPPSSIALGHPSR